jgi:hypothetical protein
MKIFEITSGDELWIVIEEDKNKALDLVLQGYFEDTLDDDLPTFEIEEKRGLTKGIVLSYDYEDIYWHKE